MKKILVGYIGRGKTSGIDKYLFSFLEQMKEKNVKVDFLTRDEDENLKNELAKKGSNVYLVPSNKHFIKSFVKMKKIIKENNYDIGYFNISKTSNCIGIIASKIFGIKKIVVHSHSSGIESHNFLIKCISFLFNLVFKPIISICSDLNLACSDKAAKWLFSKNVYDNDDYYVMYNVVNYEKFKYDEATRIKVRNKLGINDKFVVGHVGRFTYPKNHKFLIDIFVEYKKINSNSVLVCIGDGQDFDKIKEYSKKMGVFDDIIFAGAVDNVNEMIQAFDCFLLPSKFEGLPVVGIEAQFSQTKCILSNKITKMALISNDNLFLPIKNPKTWAKNISSKKTRLSENAEKFKSEKNKNQFDIILNKNSEKYNIPFLLLKALLIIHYFLNLTVFYNGFNYIMYVCGVLLFIIIFFSHPPYYIIKNENIKIFVIYTLFLISYLISSFLIYKYNIVGSTKTFIWTVLHLFFIFNTNYIKSTNCLKKEVYILSKLIILSLTIINIHNVYLLWNFVSSTVYDFGGKIHLIGLANWGRFYGNFYDANYASVACICAIFLAIYLIKICKSYFDKILLLLSILIQLVYIYLGQSRTGLYSFAVGLTIFVIMNYVLKKPRIRKILFSSAVLFLVIMVLPKKFLNTYNYIYSSKENLIDVRDDELIIVDDDIDDADIFYEFEKNENLIKNNEKNTIVGRSDYGSDVSNGRFSIWKNGLEIFENNIVLGVGFDNMPKYVKKYMPKSYIAQKKFSAFHNVFLDVLVSQGVIGAIIFIFIIIYYLYLNFKKFKLVINSKNYYLYVIILSIICSILFSSLFVSQIFYVNNFNTFMFWMILGYLNSLLIDTKNKSYKKNNSRN